MSELPAEKTLSQKIWITRKSRIEAATRLEWNAYWSSFLIPYYSLFLVIVAAIDFKKGEIDYSFTSLVASIVILCFSILVSSSRFQERSLALKACYLNLDKLYQDAKFAEQSSNSTAKKKLLDIGESYMEVQSANENHTHCDFILAKYRLSHDSDFQLSITEKRKLYSYKTGRAFFLISLFVIPALIVIWIQIS